MLLAERAGIKENGQAWFPTHGRSVIVSGSSAT